MRRILVGALMVLGLCAGASWADNAAEALALFREYESRSARFDASVADLYAENARITTRRIMPDGSVRTLSFRGSDWKSLIRQAMPAAKQRGNINSFRQVTTRPEGDRVFVRAERHSQLKGYTSPFTMVLQRDLNGAWKIVEEQSETRP